MPNTTLPNKRLKVVIRGAVQGVGFRPFIHRMATQLTLGGWVVNTAQGVVIEVEGRRPSLDTFLERLELECPPRCFLHSVETTWLDPVGMSRFEIRVSESVGPISTLVLPDLATCPDCVRETFDASGRRYLYPFTNCTNCGPRYTIIESLPYDRANTSMKGFRMCPLCRLEYNNARDRRFHAQPIACPQCGPQLSFWDRRGRPLAAGHAAMLRTAEALAEGRIVAVKGLGGFHLMVSARSEKAVARLRQLKQRDEKPFAVMFPALAAVEEFCELTPADQRLLVSSEAPIVLLPRRSQRGRPGAPIIAGAVAPNNPLLGVLLPYTPLHHVLMNLVGFPVVATSGNLRDEPVCTDELDALKRFGAMVDYFLVHNRPILRHADDSVVRLVLGRELVLRRARGYAPLPVGVMPTSRWHAVAEDAPVVLGVGAHLKNSVALAARGQLFLSQHVGDLETEPALLAAERVAADLGRLYQVTPDIVVADLHPDYLSTQWAERLATGAPLPLPKPIPPVAKAAVGGIRMAAPDDLRPWAKRSAGSKPPAPTGKPAAFFQVQHHLAHILSCMAENEIEPPVLGVAWDGAGLGTDGTIWGGEFLRIHEGGWERVAHLRPFRLPGGDAAVKEPRRAALGLVYAAHGAAAFAEEGSRLLEMFSAEELANFRTMLECGLNSPITTSAGRLFDAVAALLMGRRVSAYEGQAAMEVELAVSTGWSDKAYRFPLLPAEATGGAAQLDWAPLMEDLLADVKDRASVTMAATRFHDALVRGIVSVAQAMGIERVALSGGCFQNLYLTERVVLKLQEKGFKPYWHQRVPPNDGGLAVGQVLAVRKGFAVQRELPRSAPIPELAGEGL